MKFMNNGALSGTKTYYLSAEIYVDILSRTTALNDTKVEDIISFSKTSVRNKANSSALLSLIRYLDEIE